jgi:uncharacterized protein (TIGR02598 family)
MLPWLRLLRISSRTRASRPSAFTLIEVVVAIAVVSTALIACVALNSTSLATLRDARTRETASRICKTVLSEIGSRDFYSLPASSLILNFNNEGIKVASNSAESVYVVEASPFSPQIVESSATRSFTTLKGLRVCVYQGTQISSSSLLLTRTMVLANRSKQN